MKLKNKIGEIYKKKLDNITYIRFKEASTEIEHNMLYLYNDNKEEIYKTKFEMFEQYILEGCNNEIKRLQEENDKLKKAYIVQTVVVESNKLGRLLMQFRLTK